jgi:hypothetical protein
MSATTRKQEVLIAGVLATIVTAAVAIAVVAGARTVGAFVAGAGGAATVAIFVALTNRKLRRERRK